jgi:glycosyltransferase involved in cell wall biosynthesis
MTSLKGGRILLDALPRVAWSLQRNLHVIFAGDGPERANWERHATRIKRSHPAVGIEFIGWANEDRLRVVFEQTHLLVVPSVWPEPFGLVGPEAGLYGVPAAAFKVGGIPDWLIDGVNGYLAPGDVPSSRGLAKAIIRCLQDSKLYANLCAGALEAARRLSMQLHLRELLPILEKATEAGRAVAAPQHATGASLELAND